MRTWEEGVDVHMTGKEESEEEWSVLCDLFFLSGGWDRIRIGRGKMKKRLISKQAKKTSHC